MVEGRGADRWNHTSHLMAQQFNLQRNPKKQRAMKPGDFNPHAPSRRRSGGRQRVSVEQLTREMMAIVDGRRRKAERAARTARRKENS